MNGRSSNSIPFGNAVKEFFKPTKVEIAESLRRTAIIVERDLAAGLEKAFNNLEEIRADLQILINQETPESKMQTECAKTEVLP